MEPKKKSPPSPLPRAAADEKLVRPLFPVRILAPVSLAAIGAVAFTGLTATDDHECNMRRPDESIFDRGAHAAKRAYQRTLGSFIEPAGTTSSSGGLKMTVQRPRGTSTPHAARASYVRASNEGTTMPSGADGAEAAADAAR
jgi:hypothetical protein